MFIESIKMRRFYIIALSTFLASCAGRDPQPVAISQATDPNLSCEQIQVETTGNDQKIASLGSEKGVKAAQNITAGVVGLFIWPVWALMDFKGAASTEQQALQQRNAYLATLAQQRCGAPSTVVKAAAAPPPAT